MIKYQTILLLIIVQTTFAQSAKKAPFFDDFKDNRNQWHQFEEKEASGKIEKGKYLFTHHRTVGSWSLWNTIALDTQKDFTIEAKIQFLGGYDSHGYGLIWGARDLENKYFFLVTSKGFYTVRKMEGGKVKDIKPWTGNVYIRQGNEENLLKITKLGKNMLFYANNELIFATDFQPFFGDEMGFTLARNMKIAVDYLKVNYEE